MHTSNIVAKDGSVEKIITQATGTGTIVTQAGSVETI
jgi:hypothetical protein